MDLLEELAEFSSDPLGFAVWAFPWGEPGSELEHRDLEDWQVALLDDIGQRLRKAEITVAEAIQLARTSGHGIGKSALVSIVILWAISTYEDTKGVVTANTENQLKTKTWVELAKWYRLFIARGLFKMTATALFSADPEHERTWRIDMVPWSERNTEAFAGLHNQGKRILVVFDEASAIPDIIWETTEGAMTDQGTQVLWLAFGNPTRNKGRFRDCFTGGRFAHRWTSAAIDSREVSITDKSLIQKWIDDYGEDSDFVRVRVRGVFPRIDSESFISFDVVLRATNRELPFREAGAVVLGVDVARFGDDATVIYPRCGRDARSRPVEIYRGIDTMATAGKVAAAVLRHRASAAFVDEGGVGGGVVDRLRQLRIPVFGVDFGSSPDGFGDDQTKYANKRAEIWGAMREWLKTGSIPEMMTGENVTLATELTAPNYGFRRSDDSILLEGKAEMRKRKVASPNVADALACTFAMPFMELEITDPALDEMRKLAEHTRDDYDPFSKEAMYG